MQKLCIKDKDILLSELKKESKLRLDFRALHRMHCVLLVGNGLSCYRVGEWFGDDPRTIQRWVNSYNKFGVYGLWECSKGRPPKIPNSLFLKLSQELRKKPSELGYTQKNWNGKLLSLHLEYSYSLSLSVRQCQRLLHRSMNHYTFEEQLPD